MSDPKETIQRYIEEVLNQRNYKTFDELVSDDFQSSWIKPGLTLKNDLLQRLKHEDPTDTFYLVFDIIANSKRAWLNLHQYHLLKDNPEDTRMFQEHYQNDMWYHDVNTSFISDDELTKILNDFKNSLVKFKATYWIYNYDDDGKITDIHPLRADLSEHLVSKGTVESHKLQAKSNLER
jgi:hypothetical protein